MDNDKVSGPGVSPATGAAPIVHIVDDNEDHVRLIATYLRDAGYQYRIYSSGQALMEATLVPPACILLDNVMPGMSGLQVQEALLARCSAFPIVFMSGSSPYEDVFEASRKGAYAFLQKPFSREKLIALIQASLGGAPADRQQVARIEDDRRLYASLTDREKEVFALLVGGKSNKMIARELDIALRTVEFHRANVQRKLNANFLSDLIALARRLRIG